MRKEIYDVEKFREKFLKGNFLKLEYDFVIGNKNHLNAAEWFCISALLAQSNMKRSDRVQIYDDFLCEQAILTESYLEKCKISLKERGFFDYSVDENKYGRIYTTYYLNKRKINEFKNS